MAGNIEFDIGGIVSGLFSGFDGLFTSDEERLAAEFKLEGLLHDRLKMQALTNQIEAAHPSIFVSGWRPFIGWVCGVGIGFQFVMRPIMQWANDSLSILLGNPQMPMIPSLDVEQLISLVVAMLGIAGYRSYEKMKDKARVN